MALITKPNTFSANTTIASSEVNNNFDTIYNEFNGNIAAANLGADSVTTAKIADSAVTTAKIADDAVTSGKLSSTVSFGAYQNSAQSLASSTATKIQFQVEEFDEGGDFDNATNYRFTAPKAGKYLFSTTVQVSTPGDGTTINVNLHKNGSEFKRVLQVTGGGSTSTAYGGSALLDLAANDYIEVYALQNSGSSKNTINGQNNTWFNGFLVGA